MVSSTPALYCLLGDIEFDLGCSFESFRHTSGIALSEHPTILNAPVLQFTGRELDTLSLGFNWHVGWCDPDEQIQQLWDAMEEAEPLQLTFGSNTYKKRWAIKSVDSSLTQTTPAGETISIQASVKLIESTRRPKRRKRGRAVRQRNTGLAAFARRA